jgi:hypothetical protein
MVVHNDAREDFPWSGTALAMHIVRFLSILMGLGTVYITYRLGRVLFPQTPLIALAAAVFTAFNPMFLFVSAAINNDNLSTLLASLLLLMIVRLVQEARPARRFYVLLGLVAGTGMLAKFQIGFMLPLVALALLIVSIRARDWRPIVIGGAISGGLTILIAGWWYWRNYHLYGDATGINVFLDIVGRRAVPADWHQLWTERDTFMMSFWGLFGGVNVPMESGIYSLFNLIVMVSVAGLIFGLLMWLWRHARQRSPLTITPLMLARLFALVWPLIVFLSLLSWTRQTWASQGRLWFSAIAALSIWLAAGLAAWTPNPGFTRNFNFGAVGVVFIGVAITAPFVTIRPAYTLDADATWPGETLQVEGYLPACFRETQSDQDALCMAAQPLAGDLWPGDYLVLSPVLTVKNPMAHDWSIFVHLVSEDGNIEAQRDVYPGGGLLATSDLRSGETWNNLIAVKIPEGIYTPQNLDVYIGFYDLPTGERMSLVGAGDRVDPVLNRFYLGQIQLTPPPGSVPNPVHVDFGGELTLLGYEISDRSLPPGATTVVTLYWSARHVLKTSYTISIQVIDPDPARLTKAAQDDSPPVPPVTDWPPGETQSETRTLTIAPDAVPGRYRLLVRVYADPAHPLHIRTQAGGQSQDFVWLSWLQVEPPG